MEISWSEAWSLFRWAFLAALCAGLVCPPVGCYLLVRRTGFYGIALPQFAAAGVACGWALLPWWSAHVGLGGLDAAAAYQDPHAHAVVNYHLAWAGAFTFGGLGAMAFFGRRPETETGRVAAAFAIANAATVLFALASPTGKEFIESMLRGELLAVDLHAFETLAVVLGVVVVALAVFWRDLLVVSYDREFARVLNKRVRSFEVLLLALVGLTVSIGTLIVGPLVLFGLLVVPPLIAQRLARSMGSFLVLAALLGAGAAALGIWTSLRLDWPLGPSLVAAAAVEMVLVWPLRARA